jgi:hypothetical protein
MKIKLIFLCLLTFNAMADLDSNLKIIENSEIKASDLNSKFAELNSYLDIPISFSSFNVGQEVNSLFLKNELMKISGVFSDLSEINLSSEINSVIINSVFDVAISKIKFLKDFIYDVSCNCYRDVDYVNNDSVNWIVDNGFYINDVVKRDMNVYLPTGTPNGKMIIYTHPVGETKDMNGIFASGFLESMTGEGYLVSSVEFRHPILEGSQLNNLAEDQVDIIRAVRKIRENYSHLGMNNPDSLISVGYSKGSFILSNILSNEPLLIDEFGRMVFEKVYLYDGQITYNFDTYHSLFIVDTLPSLICYVEFLGSCLVGEFTPYQALAFVNDDVLVGLGTIALTRDPNVNESYRNVKNVPLMTNLSLNEYIPEIRFGNNQPNVGKRSPQFLVDSSLNIDYGEFDYLLHQPMSPNYFCTELLPYSTNCSSISNLGFLYEDVYNDMLNFFDE